MKIKTKKNKGENKMNKIFLIVFILIQVIGFNLYSEESYGINEDNQTVKIEVESIAKQSELIPTWEERQTFVLSVLPYNSLVIFDRVNQIVIERKDVFSYPSLYLSKISKDVWLIQYLKLKYVDDENNHNFIIEKEFLWKWTDRKTIDSIRKEILDVYILDTNPLINLEKGTN